MKLTGLERPERRFDVLAAAAFFHGKRVLITGAAGSIGSALALRLAELGCERLALLDQFDHGLIDIVEKVKRAAPDLAVTEALCDVRDSARLDAWMRRIEPDVVIHSAALKHVHLGERHPVECVLTNLIGVRNAAAAAADAGASHFILISSDKAAAPTCLMGATKRLAELFLLGLEKDHANKMRARAVRFGNVWGSQGSVLPRFAAQIEADGPLEVTHPEMERFFMTTEEAVGLILSVAAVESEPGTYFMEMGEPISILDLGRSMITDSGKSIEIKFTGLRAGEKLHEQLIDEFEDSAPSTISGVFRVAPRAAGAYVTASDIAHLETIARTMENALVRQRVFASLEERLKSVRKAG